MANQEQLVMQQQSPLIRQVFMDQQDFMPQQIVRQQLLTQYLSTMSDDDFL